VKKGARLSAFFAWQKRDLPCLLPQSAVFCHHRDMRKNAAQVEFGHKKQRRKHDRTYEKKNTCFGFDVGARRVRVRAAASRAVPIPIPI
jgi:hypothetical protein